MDVYEDNNNEEDDNDDLLTKTMSTYFLNFFKTTTVYEYHLSKYNYFIQSTWRASVAGEEEKKENWFGRGKRTIMISYKRSGFYRFINYLHILSNVLLLIALLYILVDYEINDQGGDNMISNYTCVVFLAVSGLWFLFYLWNLFIICLNSIFLNKVLKYCFEVKADQDIGRFHNSFVDLTKINASKFSEINQERQTLLNKFRESDEESTKTVYGMLYKKEWKKKYYNRPRNWIIVLFIYYLIIGIIYSSIFYFKVYEIYFDKSNDGSSLNSSTD
eukprot:TRINITY_DN4154_c0_g1_i1.p1 TRINITY_DN4154_c0_g1~~TRINITY_DN4154_c0_g1_i1.p1  ORF type:complete len:274 (+),score=38.51 TRINITY_DN4154_c0_g1_i1:201-1022(+)